MTSSNFVGSDSILGSSIGSGSVENSKPEELKKEKANIFGGGSLFGSLPVSQQPAKEAIVPKPADQQPNNQSDKPALSPFSNVNPFATSSSNVFLLQSSNSAFNQIDPSKQSSSFGSLFKSPANDNKPNIFQSTPNQTPSGLFGNKSNAQAMFGNKNDSNSGSLFGNPVKTPPSLFGKK